MEKVLANMPNNQEVKAEKILEINGNHELFKTLEIFKISCLVFFNKIVIKDILNSACLLIIQFTISGKYFL